MKRLGAVGMVALCAWACGSTAVIEPGAGGGGSHGGQGGEGGNGAGATGGGDLLPVFCPGALPSQGGACELSGQHCAYPDGTCERFADCESGSWVVGDDGACLCPTEIPTGEACDSKGQACDYTLPSCDSTTISVSCSSEGVWVVSQSSAECGFVCPLDPGDLPPTCDPCCHHPCAHIDGCGSWWATCEPDGHWSVTVTPC